MSQEASVEPVSWIRSALKAAEIVQNVADRREGIQAATRSLGVGTEMVRRQLDLLAYVSQYAPLHEVRASQTKLEIFRSIERADPVRGLALRPKVLADRLNLRELQVELDDAKRRLGLRRPVSLTLDDILALCRKDLPVLDRLVPPIEREPQGDALWIGADLDWSLRLPERSPLPTWCVMVSNNIACSRMSRLSFYDVITRVGMAALRYTAVSVVLATDQERDTLAAVLGWAARRVDTTFFLHGIEAKSMEVVGPGNPFAAAESAGAIALAKAG